jgi:hypothetical protein
MITTCVQNVALESFDEFTEASRNILDDLVLTTNSFLIRIAYPEDGNLGHRTGLFEAAMF